MIQKMLLLLCLAGVASPAFAWGFRGHYMIARLAEMRLKPATRQAIKVLLAADQDDPPQVICGELTANAPGNFEVPESITEIASYADAVRDAPIGDGTDHWHFIDIRVGETANTFNADKYCKAKIAKRFQFNAAKNCYDRIPPEDQVKVTVLDDCSARQIDTLRKQLADATLPVAQRIRALKFIVHVVGDLHQPLHDAELNFDVGGNIRKVSFLGHEDNLHSIWDDDILETVIKTTVGQAQGFSAAQASSTSVSSKARENFLRQLNSRADLAVAAGWLKAAVSPVDWAFESYELAAKVTYAGINPDKSETTTLDDAYVQASRATLVEQIMRGGYRLARVLDDALAP